MKVLKSYNNTSLNVFYNDDTLTILKQIPDNSIDLIITSPPYNKNHITNNSNPNGKIGKTVLYDKYKDNKDFDSYKIEQIEVLNECFRILKPGSSMFYNHKNNCKNCKTVSPIEWIKDFNFNFRQEIIWDRCISANLRSYVYFQTDERIYWLYKPNFNDKNPDVGKEFLKGKNNNHSFFTTIWRFMPERNNPHPAPFPLVLPLRIILSLFEMNGNKIILDPYSGSGTTSIASILTNNYYIGIEMSREYINQSINRLNELNEFEKEFNDEYNLHFKN